MVILGYTNDGEKFRPSDWAFRLAETAACFYPQGKKLDYTSCARPQYVNGVTLFVLLPELEIEFPECFRYIMWFAEFHDLVIEENIYNPNNAPACG